MEVPVTPGYDGDTESFEGENIPWTRPGGESKNEPKFAHESDMIPTLEHPKLPNSRWINDKILETWYQPYSKSSEALERMIRDQARYPPVLIAHIKGTHTSKSKKVEFILKPVSTPQSPRGFFGERIPRTTIQQKQKMVLREKEIETKEEDFDIKIDMTYLLAQLPSFSVPPSPRFAIPKNLRSRLHPVKDGVKAMRGGMFIPRLWPNSSSLLAGEDALQFWFRKYIEEDTILCRKRFILSRKVTQFDSDKLKSMLQGLIRSTNYQRNIDIKFITTKNTLIVTTRNGFVDLLNWYHYVFWIFYYLFGMLSFSILLSIFKTSSSPLYAMILFPSLTWYLFWPSTIFFRLRDYRVLSATFPFGSDLKNSANYSRGQDAYVSGSRIVKRTGGYMASAEQVFFNDWKNAVRRGVRERYKGAMDTNYLVESNDLYEGFGIRSGRRRGLFEQARANETRDLDDRPWGGDEDKGIAWN